MFLNINYLRIVIVLFGLFSGVPLQAQQAPGNVTNNLGLWLRAGDLSITNHSTNSWPDARTSTTNQAVFDKPNNATSYYEVIRDINFNNSVHINDEWFDYPLDLRNAGEVNVFTVYTLPTAGTVPLWGNGGSNLGKQATTTTMSNSPSTTQTYTGADASSTTYINHINSIDGGQSSIYINGTTSPIQYNTTSTVAASGLHSGVYLGKVNSANNLGTVNVGEFVVYTGRLSAAEWEQITSYLGIKYGVHLSHDYTINGGTIPAWTRAQHTGFNHHIIGLAKDPSSGLDQTSSRNGIITIEAAAAIPNNNAFLLGENALHSTTGVPFHSSENYFAQGTRIDKVWNCQKTSGFPNVNLKISNSIRMPNGFSIENFCLLVADDANFTTNLKAYPLVNNATNGTYDASNVPLANNQFFTIARSNGALWVRSDATDNIITSNRVDQLTDQVLGLNTMTGMVVSSGSTKPNHTAGTASSAINFNPFVTFNQGSNHNYVEKSNFVGFGNSGVSAFLVVRRDGNDTGNEALFSYAVPSQHNEWLMDDPSDLEVYVEVGLLGSGHHHNFDIENNRPHVVTNVRGNNANDRLGVDGIHHGKSYKNTTAIDAGGTFIFGQEQDALGGNFDNDQEYEGDFVEAIILGKRASAQEEQAIESYLAVKYGITLARNYRLSDNAISWNRSTNNHYNNNITGIGRDDVFALNQQKSTNQTGNNVHVTIEHSGAFTNDVAHLIWGCRNCGASDYDDVSFSNATQTQGYKLSKKRWKVQNNGNKIGPVSVTLEIPPSLVSQNMTNIRLVVSQFSDFRTSGISSYGGNVANGYITFNGVSLSDGHFFTIGTEESVSFVNHDAGSPTNFEACPGTAVSFFYNGLSAHPNRVRLTDTTGAALNIPVSPTAQGQSNGQYFGRINMTIPANAATGNVLLLAGNTLLYDFNNNLVIHNPTLEFLPLTSPVCATDTIPLIGIPSGGTFTSGVPLVTNGQLLTPAGLSWQANHQGVRSENVTYNYRPTYSNGTNCPQNVRKTKTIDIRDNRLNNVTYGYIIKRPPNIPDEILHLDSTNIVNSTTPNLRTVGFTYPISFSGTYVTYDTSAGVFNFLTSQAKASNQVTISYNNGGCIGTATGEINVYPPLRIVGLWDTICSEAAPIQFGRDPLPDYAHRLDTAHSSFGTTRTTYYHEYNKISRVIATNGSGIVNQSYQIAIDTITVSPNSEVYEFSPSKLNLPPGATVTIPVEMHYRTTVRKEEVTASSPTPTINFSHYDVIAFDTIHIVSRPTPLIRNVDSVYCTNSPVVHLNNTPYFEYDPRTRVQFRGNDAFGYNLIDSLLSDTIFNPAHHYSRLVPDSNRHLDVQLIYTVERYGCTDRDTAYTRIAAPVQPIFISRPAYCESDFPTPLTPSYHPSSFVPFSSTGRFLPLSGLDTLTNLFSPGIALAGNHLATYELTDNFGCITTYTDTLFVREPPQIKIVAGSLGTNAFCANETHVPLSSLLLSGGVADSIRYFGAGVTGDTLDPSGIFLNPTGGPSAGGNSQISNLYIDSFGCAGRDTLDILIREVPKLKIDSSFNNTLKYCANDPRFEIEGFVLNQAGQPVLGSGLITGAGVTSTSIITDTTYYYDPSSITFDSLYHDTIHYTHTDQYGCSNTVNIILQIDSIPELTLTGLDTSYCVNYVQGQLIGMPDATSPYHRITYGGPGVIPNTGTFNPSSAGTGQKIVSYTFVDQNFCQSTIYDTTVVYSLPVPLFGDYDNQYCTAADKDTLSSLNSQNPNSSFRFWGSIIADSIGILDPGMDTSGVKTIYYSYTDSLNCTNSDSVNVFVHPTPEIEISGLDSAYCFNAPEDNISVFPSGASSLISPHAGFSISGNIITFDPDEDTAGIKSFVYIYTDVGTGCADTASLRTFVYKPPTPSYTGLDNFYCETRDTFPITGIPAGGTFSGLGVIGNNGFGPAKAGGGLHTITYAVNDTLIYNSSADTLICLTDTSTNVRVRPLPIPTILSPTNNKRFCSNDTLHPLVHGAFGSRTWTLFKDTSGAVVSTIRSVHDTISYNPVNIIVRSDTTYYFDPRYVVEGTHFVTYIATDSATGCQDSVQYTYIVDHYTSPFFAIDSVYCESADSVLLYGVPGGGQFYRNGVAIAGNPPYFHPNPDTNNISHVLIDTIVYKVRDGACDGVDSQFVQINPVPIISFSGDSSRPHNVYCLSMDSIPLTPNIMGGEFRGNGIPFGDSIFRPSFAGAGFHKLYYTYTDPTTACSNEHEETFYVYGMPQVDFHIEGGCQSDSILFVPNNSILGLQNFFQNRVIDSITNITWEFEPDSLFSGSSQNNSIDSIYRVFQAPGIYFTKLSVANQVHCIDSHTVRWVVSPKVSSFPYDEDFESSHGNWYPEARDETHNLLWEWGIDTTPAGITSSNNFWGTELNTPYLAEEDAWVYSPCFDLSNLERPMIKFNHWSDTRANTDGVVLEYQKQDGTWAPLGEIDRGINWYNTPIISGQPGDQNLAPIGWSGKSNGWVDSRYMLDNFANSTNNLLRLRFAFGSPSVNLNTFYDGFGFDNVWVGNRSRNVLLETVANRGLLDMAAINNHMYNLAFHSYINQDVVLMQYHYKIPLATDEFYLFNEGLAENRATLYKFLDTGPGYTFIDGDRNNKKYSKDLEVADLEEHMLDFPKFDVRIDTFHHNSFGVFTAEVTVEALENMPLDEYAIRIVITEDSLTYSGGFGSELHAVVREDNREEDDSLFYVKGTWSIGQTKTINFDWNHNSTNINYKPGHFQVVAYVQSVTGDNPVFQATTSRDVSGYWVGVDQVKAEPELQEIVNMNLYPNPARDYFKVDFEEELQQDYQWKLVDLRGVEYQSGILEAGVQQLEVENYDLPTGIYIFSVYNENVFAHKKVVINRD